MAHRHRNCGEHSNSHPLRISSGAPEQHLAGQVVAIHLSGNCFVPITQQSINFTDAIVEYTDRLLLVHHNTGTIVVSPSISTIDPDVFRYTFRPPRGEAVTFDNIVFSRNGSVERLEYRWNDSWLFIIAEEYNLVLARDAAPYGGESPSTDGDYPLDWSENNTADP